MYILYLDESGVPEVHPSQTSHYILLGLAVHEGTWFALSKRVDGLKKRYALGNLEHFELHAAWIRRPYPEQSQIPGFEELGAQARHDAVQEIRQTVKEKVWPKLSGSKRRGEARNFRMTEPYIHLTYDERLRLLEEALSVVGSYRRGVTLFAEAIRKDWLLPGIDAIDQAFTQVVTRFELFLRARRDQRSIGAYWRLTTMSTRHRG